MICYCTYIFVVHNKQTLKFTRASAPILNVTLFVFLHDMFGAGGNGSSHTGFSQVSFFCVIIHVVDLGYLIQKERGCFITFIGTFYQNIVVQGARLLKISYRGSFHATELLLLLLSHNFAPSLCCYY